MIYITPAVLSIKQAFQLKEENYIALPLFILEKCIFPVLFYVFLYVLIELVCLFLSSHFVHSKIHLVENKGSAAS